MILHKGSQKLSYQLKIPNSPGSFLCCCCYFWCFLWWYFGIIEGTIPVFVVAPNVKSAKYEMGETCRDVGRQAKTNLISVKTVEKFSSWHKRWNAEKSENWLNCVSKSFFTALVWNRRQLKRQNADSAITGTSHIQRWQQPNIVHLKNFQSFKYYMKCDIQIPNSQSHVCLTYYIDDTNHIVSGYKLLFIKHDWNMKERNYLSLKRRNTRATPEKWAI